MGLTVDRDRLRGLLTAAVEAGIDALADGLAEAVPPAGPVQMVPPSALVVDPRRFQFRVSVVNLSGTDGRLRDACRWNPALAGVLLVWRQPDGRLALVDGHHRLRLALANDVAQVAVLLIEAADATAARVVGGLANLAAGTATAADVAKLMRDAGMTAAAIAAHGISPRSRILKAAAALVPLADPLFARVCTGEMSPEVGAALATAGPPAVQRDLWREAERRHWSADQIAEAAALARLATVTTNTPTGCLPGFEALLQAENSNLGAILAVRAAIRRQLGQEVAALVAVARKRSATSLENRGVAVIDQQAAAEHRDAGRAHCRLFDHLAGQAGPLQDCIAALAQLVTDRSTAAQVVAAQIDTVRAAIESELH